MNDITVFQIQGFNNLRFGLFKDFEFPVPQLSLAPDVCFVQIIIQYLYPLYSINYKFQIKLQMNF